MPYDRAGLSYNRISVTLISDSMRAA